MQNTIELTPAQLILALIGATGLGSLLSFIFALLGQAIERRSRVKELLLSKAVEMAHHRTETIANAAKHTGQPLVIESPILYTFEIYQELTHLFKTGKLPTQTKATLDQLHNEYEG